jgi:hypothetical protein
MTGSFRISDPKFTVPEHIAMNILVRTKKPLATYKRKGDIYSGPELFSSTLPMSFARTK